MKIFHVLKISGKAAIYTTIFTVVSVLSALFLYATFIEFDHKADISAENNKVVYLTFDDGPSEYTPAVLDILEEQNVKATFFVVGNTPYTSYMRDIVQKGHAIGLHSYNHEFAQIYRTTNAFFEDLKKIDEVVFNETGVHSKIMRFPGGSSVRRGTTKARMDELKVEVQKNGYQYFDWNSETGDAAGISSVDGALSRMKSTLNEAGDTVVVLMHDTQKITVNTLPGIIDYFRKQGFTFKTLSPSSPPIQHTW